MKNKGFSLLELMIGLVIISVLLVCITPLMTKKKKGAPVVGADGVPVGTIVMYLGQDPPEGWLLCNGQTFNTVKYPELRDYLGGDRTPDLRGYVPRGATQKDIDEANK